MAAIANRTHRAETTIPVYFLLRDATMTLDLMGPAEVLRYANRIAEREGRADFFALRYVSAADHINTSLGLGLTGFGPLPDSLPPNAMVVLHGCVGSDDDFSSANDQRAVGWLRAQWQDSHRLLCSCTGALLAGYAGLLDGRQCTTHHSHCDALRSIAPRAHVLENRIFVEDRNIYTSAGVTTGIDLALHVVAQIAGHARSASIARSLVIYMRRAGSDRLFGDIGKIESMRADQYRFADRERFDQVLSAHGQQAAADESHVAHGVIGKHLAHGIAHQHLDLGRHRLLAEAAAA